MKIPFDKTEIFYVQKSKNGFLSDSEWDGDSFSSSPLYAWKYQHTESMPHNGCEWKKIEVIHTLHQEHFITIKKTTKNGILAYRLECSVCKTSNRATRIPITEEDFIARYPYCITSNWKFINDEVEP